MADSVFEMSGKGQDVKSIELPDGVYFCRFTINGNVNARGRAELFSAECEGRQRGYTGLGSGIAENWTGRRKIAVGDDDFVGVIDVEVQAAPAADWVVTFERQ